MARQFGGVHPSRNSRSGTLLIVGFILFLLFALIAYFLYTSQVKGGAAAPQAANNSTNNTAAVDPEIRMMAVLVPIQEIKEGTPLEKRMFRKDSRPKVGVSDRAVQDFEEITGNFARTMLVPGQPLHRDFITSIKPTNVLTAKIPEGFRAVTIRVDARTSVEGFVRPDAHVDVEWATRINGTPAIVTIVENAKVLSAERQTQSQTAQGAPVPSTVTLLVTAKDAKKIQLATTTGKLSLSLRGDEDPGSAGGGGITLKDLMPGGKKRTQENVDGTVTIGGVRWLLVDGKLVPASKASEEGAAN